METILEEVPMRQRRYVWARQPPRGMRTWRLAIAFGGIAGAYSLFDTLYFVQYRTKGEVSLLHAIGFPLAIALVSVCVAYGRWSIRKLNDRWNVHSRKQGRTT